jgi:hypothetical protein
MQSSSNFKQTTINALDLTYLRKSRQISGRTACFRAYISTRGYPVISNFRFFNNSRTNICGYNQVHCAVSRVLVR